MLLTLLLLAACGTPAAPTTAPAEVRGVWITNTDSSFLASRENIERGMTALARANFNVVFPVVWSKGLTVYPSPTLARVLGDGRDRDPTYAGRDVLREVVDAAHRHGLEVIPWFEFGFTAGHDSIGAPVLEAHPDWAAIGSDGQPVVKNGFHWMNPLDPEVRAFVQGMILEVCRNYAVDGVQGDDRLPAMPCEAGYDPRTRAAWARATGKPSPGEPRDPQWTGWRADQLTAWLAELRDAVKMVDPGLVFSMGPGGPGWSYREYLQDQDSWLEQGLLDAMHPQLYARDLNSYRGFVHGMLERPAFGDRREVISPGVLLRIGDWYADQELLLGAIRWNRQNRLAGTVLFFDGGLFAEGGLRLKWLREGPYRLPAPLPWVD